MKEQKKQEIHFNVDEELLRRFKTALQKSGFSTQSEFFRSKMRELAETMKAKSEERTLK
jgi:metal-responsive CopG/Arc/MetJ family transcriptional regulator